MEREELRGGVNVVTRTGGTVLRPTGPWTPNVHALLRHLRDQGFTGAPAVYGLTADGREELEYIAGEVCSLPLRGPAASATALISAARLLRRCHDATVSFVADHLEGWQLPARSPPEVVCHGDFAPYNVVMDGAHVVALIDFDTAHPGPRRWDLAYAIYRNPCLIDRGRRSYADCVDFVLFIVNAHRYRCPPPQAGCGVARD